MSKICRYSCEHNKSGVCQISVCDKRTRKERGVRMSKILIYSQEDLDLILELEKQENEELQQENKQLKECYCNRTDCSGRIKNSRKYDSLYQKYNKQLDNWNELKEYLHNVDVVIDYSENYDGKFINYDELIDKMQELEQGSDK